MTRIGVRSVVDPNLGDCNYLDCVHCRTINEGGFQHQQCHHCIEAILEEDPVTMFSPGHWYMVNLSLHSSNRPYGIASIGWAAAMAVPVPGNKDAYVLRVLFNENDPTSYADLGGMTTSEGHLIAARMIHDYVVSKASPEENLRGGIVKTKCPSREHSYYEQKELTLEPHQTRESKFFELAAIVIDGACSACQNMTYTDDNYGLDGVNQPPRRR